MRPPPPARRRGSAAALLAWSACALLLTAAPLAASGGQQSASAAATTTNFGAGDTGGHCADAARAGIDGCAPAEPSERANRYRGHDAAGSNGGGAQGALRLARALLDEADGAAKRREPLLAGQLAAEAVEALRVADAHAGASGVERWGATSPSWHRALSASAAAHSAAGAHDLAADALRTAVQVLERSPPKTAGSDGRPIEMEIIETLVDLSGEQSKAGLHDVAVATLDHLELYRPVGEASRRHFARVVSLQRGKVLRCANRLADAQEAYTRGFRLAAELGELTAAGTAAELAKRMNELVEVHNWQGHTEQSARVAADAARLAGWPSASQRPVHHFEPGLRSAPWMDLARFPSVKRLADLLVEHAPALRKEHDALAASGAFRRQTECLHDPSRGGWAYVAVVGDANPSECLADVAPAACAWAQAARRDPAAAEVVRVGYSLVEPSAWIRPHTGVDNRQLKLHLGLRVPRGDCATFTIGGEARGWREGAVNFFDDTHEHHVFNNCSASRAVLQVVLRHPDVTSARDKSPPP